MRSPVSKRLRAAGGAVLLILVGSIGCTHALGVKNLDLYNSPVRLGAIEQEPRVGVLPYTGHPDGLFYFNAIVNRLSMDPGIASVQTDFVRRRGEPTGREPDLIVSILPQVTYRSSGWNFLVNWPGFLIFTPAWNGYVYHADLVTNVTVHDGDGGIVSDTRIPISYDIRHAEMDRTIFTGLTWLEVSALAFIGGIYNANVFDRDVIAPLQVQVKDNYANFVINEVRSKIRAAAAATLTEPEVEQAEGTEEGTLPDVTAPPTP